MYYFMYYGLTVICAGSLESPISNIIIKGGAYKAVLQGNKGHMYELGKM